MNLNASAVRPNGSFLDKPLARSMSDMTLSSSMSMGSSSKDTSALRGYDTRTQIHLPPHRQQEMLDQINSTVAFVLKSMVGDRPSSVYWKPKARKKGISYYVDDNVAPGQYRFCCVSETNAHVEDVMKLFLMTDTDTLLKNYRIVYNNVLDARVLSVISYPTHQTPYKSVYVRYSSFATPALMDNRDMCLVVATDVFTHLDGSTIGYCLWDSVELDECPDYSKTHGLVRSRMFRSGFFMRTTLGADDMPCTKIVYLAGIEAGGIAPRLTTKLVVEKFGANLARVCHHFRRKNLDPTTFVHRSKWASKRDAKYCRACRHKFSALSTRTNCVACGGVVCKQCFTREKVDVPGAGLTPVHICSACLEVRGIDVSGQSHYSDSPKSVSMRSRDRSESEASRSDTSSIAM